MRETHEPGADRAVRWCAIVAALLACAQLALAQSDSGTARRDSAPRRRIQALPVIGSAPETGLQYGASVLAVWQPRDAQSTRPASLTASVMRTTKQQTRARVDAERWSDGNARRLAGMLQWQEFPLPYYGIGSGTPERAEEIFTPSGVEGSVTLQQRFAPSWYVTSGLRHVNQRIGTVTGGALRAGGITGSAGGHITEWSLGVLTDTRDNLFAPHSGRLIQASYARSADGLLSDFTYGTARFDGRLYRTIGRAHVIAVQAQAVHVDGDAPFDQLALAGNSDILRGYARGRYRDRVMAAVQGEYRTPVYRRVGGTLFGGVGAVGADPGTLTSGTLLPTYGVGLRVQLDKFHRTGVRADYGRGRDKASGLYIGFNQAF